MTADKAALLALADRCEREEPSRELDTAIAKALGKFDRMFPNSPAHVTRSLDAAVTLVPDDCVWSGGNESGFIAVVSGGSMDDDTAFMKISDGENTKGMALALCAAALRARASLEKQGG